MHGPSIEEILLRPKQNSGKNSGILERNNLCKKNPNRAVPEFVRRAERAMRRAAKNVDKEHRSLNLPIIVRENGKAVAKTV